MTSHEMSDPRTDDDRYRNRLRWGIGAFLAIAVFFLWQEHRAHLLGALPWLLLLACPAMHFFMHRGHRRRQESHHDRSAPASSEKTSNAREGHERGGHGCC
jgi:hypothetical protein